MSAQGVGWGRVALVVDDDPDCLLQMGLWLQGLGFTVVEGHSQREGERLIQQARPDVAVLDLMLEHEDSGFVLAHLMKAHHPEAPVIVVTGVAAETGFRFSDAGPREKAWIKADAVLDKGIRFEQLERELERLLPPRPLQVEA